MSSLRSRLWQLRWSFTKGFKWSDLTWKLLVFWKTGRWGDWGGRLREVVATGGSTVYKNNYVHLNSCYYFENSVGSFFFFLPWQPTETVKQDGVDRRDLCSSSSSPFPVWVMHFHMETNRNVLLIATTFKYSCFLTRGRGRLPCEKVWDALRLAWGCKSRILVLLLTKHHYC